LEITEEMERETTSEAFYFFSCFEVVEKKNWVGGDGLTGDRNCSSADIPISS